MFYDMTWLEKIIFLKQVIGGFKWISTDYEQTPYLYRAMPNMGHYYNREIDEIVGGSVGWNQFVKNGNFADTSNWSAYYGATFTVSGNVASVVGDGNATGSRIFQDTELAKNHKYIWSFDAKTDGTVQAVFILANLEATKYEYIAPTTSWQSKACIVNSGNALLTTARVHICVEASKVGTVYARNAQLTDLTLALGSTIADYVYSLEQATAGSGVAWLKEHFPKMFGQYNPYDSGSIQSVSGLVSHDTVGFNQWDEEWELGSINTTTGNPVSDNTLIRSKNFIPVLPSTNYYMTNSSGYQFMYDADKNYLGVFRINIDKTSADCRYIKFRLTSAYGTTYANDICINLSSSKNGTYEPYKHNSYALDSTVTLRGIPKLDNGKLYYDGDEYGADGTVNRKYGIVDLGTLTWHKFTNAERIFFFSNDLTNCKQVTAYYTPLNLVCAKYTVGTANTVPQSDKEVTMTINASALRIADSTYDSADESDFKTAMSGVYLVYKLATPTTETADPFTKVQVCDSNGTEAYVVVGKNLFDESTIYHGYFYSGIDDLVASEAYRTAIINNLPAGTYTFSTTLPNAYIIRYWVNGAVIGVADTKQSETFTATTEGAVAVCFRKSDSSDITESFHTQIEKGSTATSYEPYGFNIVSVGHKSKYAEK